jgi:hypothetical protein
VQAVVLLATFSRLAGEAAAGDLTYERDGELCHATAEEVWEILGRDGHLREHLVLGTIQRRAAGEEPTGGGEPPGASGPAAGPVVADAADPLQERLLELLAERPVWSLAALCEALPAPRPAVAEVEAAVEALAGQRRLHLHRFEQQLQVRRA